jgi:hypothetical protein
MLAGDYTLEVIAASIKFFGLIDLYSSANTNGDWTFRSNPRLVARFCRNPA